MDAKDVIRINPMDTDDRAKARHEDIVKRLDELGPAPVRDLLQTGGLPTNWNPIIFGWLKGK
jgi:hypothetical protein